MTDLVRFGLRSVPSETADGTLTVPLYAGGGGTTTPGRRFRR
ncbi:hypothetical protein ACWEHA_11410 [Amycolatopsis nivea]